MHKISKILDSEIDLATQLLCDCLAMFFTKKQIDTGEFEEGISWFYSELLKKETPKIVYVNSYEEFKDYHRNTHLQSSREIMTYMENFIRQKVVMPIEEKISSQVMFAVYDLAKSYLGSSEENRIWENIEGSLSTIEDYSTLENIIHFYTLQGTFLCFNFFEKIGVKMPGLYHNFNKLIKSGVFSTYFYNNLVLAVQPPKHMFTDSEGEFHDVYNKAVEFQDGSGGYFVHGKKIEDFIFENISYDYFINETNEDTKADIISIVRERVGNEGFLKFLNAIVVDEKTVRHSANYTEIIRLYKTKEKFQFLRNRFGHFGQPYCWTEIYCPSTGRNYLLDNSADFTDALEALKFLRPSFVPENLLYQWKNFAN